MEAHEVRLNNLVYQIQGEFNNESDDFDYGTPNESYIVAVDLDILALVIKSETHSNGYVFEPIPLTEDWLLKFGFKKDDYGFGGYIEINSGIMIDDNRLITTDRDGDYIYIGKEFKFVHQLQNLYFALTESELTIQTEVSNG